MIELRSHYWPATPNERELRFYVNGRLELSVFADFIQISKLTSELHKIMEGLIGNEKND